jgi:hypothetical protein
VHLCPFAKKKEKGQAKKEKGQGEAGAFFRTQLSQTVTRALVSSISYGNSFHNPAAELVMEINC